MDCKSLILTGALLCLLAMPTRATVQAAQSTVQPSPQQPAGAQLQSQPCPAGASSTDGQKGPAVSAAGITPIVTGIVAFLFGFIAWRFNERAIRRQARQDHIGMLIEIDKIYIDRPSLWLIYKDDLSQLARLDTADAGEPVRRRALIYLYLNMFDTVYDFDRHLKWRYLSWRTKSDAENAAAWEAFIRDFFDHSSEGVQIMNESRKIYSEGFCNYVSSLMPGSTGAKADAKIGNPSATSN